MTAPYVYAESSNVGAMREEQLRVWLADYGVHTLNGPSGAALLALWVQTCRELCKRNLPLVPIIRPRQYNAATGQLDPEESLGVESMAERIWPDIWKYAPLGHLLFVRRIPPTTETKGGLKIPDNAQRANHRGWVLNVGPEVGAPNIAHAPYGCPVGNPLELIGQVVTWAEYAGTPLVEQAIDQKWDGEYLQLSIAEVFAIDLAPFLSEVPHGNEAQETSVG